jgi:hypothetical protein
MKIKNVDDLIEKYKSHIDKLIVMDDYDAGVMAQMRMTLKELKKLKKSFDKTEKSGKL